MCVAHAVASDCLLASSTVYCPASVSVLVPHLCVYSIYCVQEVLNCVHDLNCVSTLLAVSPSEHFGSKVDGWIRLCGTMARCGGRVVSL